MPPSAGLPGTHESIPPQPAFFIHCRWLQTCCPAGTFPFSVTLTSNGVSGVHASGVSSVAQSVSFTPARTEQAPSRDSAINLVFMVARF